MKNIFMLLVIFFVIAVTYSFVPDLESTALCPSTRVTCSGDEETIRLDVKACIESDYVCTGEWRFYYEHSPDSWSYVLMTKTIPHDCATGCDFYTCAIGGLPYRPSFHWYLRCTSDDVGVKYDEGYVYCLTE